MKQKLSKRNGDKLQRSLQSVSNLSKQRYKKNKKALHREDMGIASNRFTSYETTGEQKERNKL